MAKKKTGHQGDAGNTGVDSGDVALAKKLVQDIQRAKRRFEDDFKQMDSDMEFCAGEQQPDSTVHYTANFTLRHINNKTASLYAKTPTVKSEVRQKMLFKLWDGDPQTIAEAQQAMALAQQGLPEGVGIEQLQGPLAEAQAVLADYNAGKEKLAQLEKVGKTLEYLLDYYWREVEPNFKQQGKQAVRRAAETGIAWCKVGYQRDVGKSPDVDARIADDRDRLAFIQGQYVEGEEPDTELKAEEERLRLAIEQLNSLEEVVLREGVVYSWPRSSAVILDPETIAIKGFVGTRWIAEEYVFSPDRIAEIYGVTVGPAVAKYTEDGKEAAAGSKQTTEEEGTGETFCLVYEVYDKPTGMMYTVCEGYEGFLEPPRKPRVDVEQFFPYFPLSFNDVEAPKRIYPPSDVSLMRDMQNEYNRTRHGLREHRIANRPSTVGPAGVLTQEDKDRMATRPPNCHIELQGLKPDDDVRKSIQTFPTSPIDPNLYDTNWVFDDLQRVVGVAEANIGGVSGSTATESSIAESTRQVGLGSNVDDMDEWLSAIARASGQVLLAQMGEEQVREIVGEGAMWPQLSRREIMRDVYLTVEAGSSGKPNKGLEISNWERMMPFLVQIPNINPKWLLKETLKRLDERVTVEEAFAAGMPSITAMNGMAAPEGAMGAMNTQAQPAQGGGAPNIGNPTQHQK